MDFSGTTCVVTGGANGIGRCIVEEFVQAGASVAFADTDETGGNLLSDRLEGKVLFFRGDIAHEAVLKAFTDTAVSRFGSVDFLINNACLTRHGLLSGCGYDDFNYVLKVGVTVPYMLTQLLLPHFTKRAAIVNIASTRATMSQPDSESYSAA